MAHGTGHTPHGSRHGFGFFRSIFMIAAFTLLWAIVPGIILGSTAAAIGAAIGFVIGVIMVIRGKH